MSKSSKNDAIYLWRKLRTKFRELENDPKYQSFIGREALPYHRQDRYIDKYHKVWFKIIKK